MERPPEVGTQEGHEPNGRLPFGEEQTERTGCPGGVPAGKVSREILHRMLAHRRHDRTDVRRLDPGALARMQRELVDFPSEHCEVDAAPIEQLLRRGRGDVDATLAREAHHPARRPAVVDPPESIGGPGANARRSQPPTLVGDARDEHERSARPEGGEGLEHADLRFVAERIGAADDEDLGPPKERRRCEIGERGSEPPGVLVTPKRAPGVRSPRDEEAAPQHVECALDEEALLAVEEVIGAERFPRQAVEWVAVRAAPPPGGRCGAQKPSIACW